MPKKEDRSDWVAVAPEHTSSNQDNVVAKAKTAFQFFQKDVSEQLKNESTDDNSGKFDLGLYSRKCRQAWNDLSESNRQKYDQLAGDDAARYARESHMKDIEAMRRRERLQQERNALPLYDANNGDGAGEYGHRTTRREYEKKQRKEKRKAEKREQKKVEKQQQQKQQKKKKQSADDDDDYCPSNDEQGDDDDDESSSSSSSYDSSSDSEEEKKRTKRPTKAPSQKQVEYRAQQQREKQAKEQYIAGRQDDLRQQRASSAKRRLEFLLKQSNIFSHFGRVKEDTVKYGIINKQQQTLTETTETTDQTTSATPQDGTTGSSHRSRAAAASSTDKDLEQEELEEADEHEATYLTKQPSTLCHGQMRPYQLEGLNWMIRLQENGVNGILADEMGLGKTLQTISILVYMLEYQNLNGPHLILVPKSTLSNWMNELQRWAPTIKAIRFHGDKATREAVIKNRLEPAMHDESNRDWHVCVTTYEVCNIEKSTLTKFAWSYLIIDEAHRLKNETSAFSKTVRLFETRYRILITGTPLQNSLHELWALLNFLVPDVFESSEQFDEWFNLDIDDNDEKNKLISQLHKILRPFMLRRLKADVEKSLPPKHETILFTGMSQMQKDLYRNILIRDIDAIQGTSGSRTAILNIVMQLRKCAGHPYLFPGVEDRTLPPLGEHLIENCGKMVLLDKLLKRLKELGHRVLLFTQMTRILDILEDYLVMRRYQYCRIDGNTSYDDREQFIDAFNAPDSEKFLFLLSTRAGGLGINLQTADVVIIYDSDWNPQMDLQAQDRAHRIGQTKPVQVFRLVTEHTIEEKIVERAQQKLKLDAMVVQSGRLKEKDKLSRDELLAAVRFGADKIFKSKDSSITEDDIDMILDVGKKKTQELNDKLKKAEKGDLLDFKFDGTSAKTFEGVDYSAAAALSQAKAEAEMLGIFDIGKRDRKEANYNENSLFQIQMTNMAQLKPKKKKKKAIKLPKSLRLPRMEEWQMYDRETLLHIQEEEEAAFKELPEEQQKLATMKRTTPTAPDQQQQEGTAPTTVTSTTTTPAEPPHPEPTTDATTICGSTADATTTTTTTTTRSEVCAVDQQLTFDNAQQQQGIAPAAATTTTTAVVGDGEPTTDATTAPPPPFELPPLISEERRDLKAKLLAEGFSNWNRLEYTAFIKASARYGRNEYDKIAVEVGASKTDNDVMAFADAFWGDRGKQRISGHEYDRVVRLIERGEKKLGELKGLERGTRVLVSLFDNPWEELEFSYVNIKDKLFTAEEDRHLLCWARKYGYGNWQAIRFAVRRNPSFRFDYFLRSLPMDVLARRCEQLMKAAEKEVEQLEKREREHRGLPTEPTAAIDDGGGGGGGEGELPPIELPKFRIIQARQRKERFEKAAAEKKQLVQNVEELEAQMQAVRDKLKALNEDSSIVSPDLPPALPTLNHKKEEDKRVVVRGGEREESSQQQQRQPIEEEQKQGGDGENKNNEGGNDESRDSNKGAMGPEGKFVEFPAYDGSEEPAEWKKPFTHFCIRTRRQVKASLENPAERKNKKIVNGILKERWLELSESEKEVWRDWSEWDKKRYSRDLAIYEKKTAGATGTVGDEKLDSAHVPKKRKSSTAANGDRDLSIPKKRRT